MDFVVIGLGLSALALLTGLTLLCLVAPRWFRKAVVAQPGDAAYARAQAGARHALGQGFLCVGAVLLLTTLGGISAGLADKAGAYLIATMTTLAALGLFGWDFLYRRQHPIPVRRRAAPARAKRTAQDPPAVPSAASPVMSPAPSTTVRRRVLPARQRTDPAAQAITATAAPFETQDDDVQHAGEEQRPEEDNLLEFPGGSPELPIITSDGPTPEAPDQSSVTDTRASGEMAEGDPQENGRARVDAEAPTVVAASRPEPESLEPAKTNGVADPTASSSPFVEPEALPHGDDRVIALFPTAAARRSRTIVAPTDPDGQS